MYRLIFKLLVIIVLAEDIAKAQESRSFEIDHYPEVGVFSTMAPVVHFLQLKTGVRLEYSEMGDRQKTPVIFLHGFTDSRHSFDYLLPLLPPDMHTIVITQRGHGNSGKPENNYLPADFAADLAAFMEEKEISQAIIAGHSMGSIIAEIFAARYPLKAKALILMSTIPDFKSNPGLVEFGNQLALLKDPIDHAFASDFQKSTISAPIPAGFLDTIVNETMKVPAVVWRSVMSGLMQVDVKTTVKDLHLPVLIMYGKKDNYSTLEDQQQLQLMIPNSKLVVYDDAGHAFIGRSLYKRVQTSLILS